MATQTLGRAFPVRRGWCARIFEFVNKTGVLRETLSNLAPGRMIDEIVIEHNSVGACIGGSIKFDGFLNWKPRTRVIEIYDGPNPVFSNRIGLAINGILTSTHSENGTRITTVPLLGLHTRDENGLAALGFSQIGQFVGPSIYILGSYLNVNNTPRRFGLTNDAAMKELFGDRVDSSWGVRTDGLRVAGFAGASGTVAVQNTDEEGNLVWGTTDLTLGPLVVDANTSGMTYQDSGYEEPAFITEAQWRMSERYWAETYIRDDNGLVPRRGSSAETGTGELQPEATELKPAPAPSKGQMVGITDGVDLVSIINGSIKNPNAYSPMYETISVSVEVTVKATFAEDETDEYVVPDAGPVQKPAQQYAYIEWAEWLGATPAPPKVQDRTTKLPSIQVESATAADWKKLASSVPIKNADGLVTGLQEVVLKPMIDLIAKGDKFFTQEMVIDDSDAFRKIKHDYATLTPERPLFQWTFSAPAALLQVVDGLAPSVSYETEVEVTTYQNGVPVVTKEKRKITTAAYKYCFGVAASANRKSTVLDLSATAIVHTNNAVHPPGRPDFPGINLPYSSEPTFQGVWDGVLFYGPLTLTNLHSASGETFTQSTTNTRMVISEGSRRTEWQSGAAQRSSNGTAANVSNDRSFGMVQP